MNSNVSWDTRPTDKRMEDADRVERSEDGVCTYNGETETLDVPSDIHEVEALSESNRRHFYPELLLVEGVVDGLDADDYYGSMKDVKRGDLPAVQPEDILSYRGEPVLYVVELMGRPRYSDVYAVLETRGGDQVAVRKTYLEMMVKADVFYIRSPERRHKMPDEGSPEFFNSGYFYEFGEDGRIRRFKLSEDSEHPLWEGLRVLSKKNGYEEFDDDDHVFAGGASYLGCEQRYRNRSFPIRSLPEETVQYRSTGYLELPTQKGREGVDVMDGFDREFESMEIDEGNDGVEECQRESDEKIFLDIDDVESDVESDVEVDVGVVSLENESCLPIGGGVMECFKPGVGLSRYIPALGKQDYGEGGVETMSLEDDLDGVPVPEDRDGCRVVRGFNITTSDYPGVESIGVDRHEMYKQLAECEADISADWVETVTDEFGRIRGFEGRDLGVSLGESENPHAEGNEYDPIGSYNARTMREKEELEKERLGHKLGDGWERWFATEDNESTSNEGVVEDECGEQERDKETRVVV